MPSLTIPNLPENLYASIEKLARVKGKTVAEVAGELMARGLSGDDQREELLLAEVRADREAMAKRGVLLTDDEINRAKRWGQE